MAITKKKRTAANAGLSPDANTDNAPCCWVCLEEGCDKAGEPLVRDCSCRGSSGFAHLSCIIKNAESEAKRTLERADGEFYTAAQFAKAFEFCPLCKQQYQNSLIYKLTKAAVDFTDRECKDIACGYLHLHTLSNRMTVIDAKNDKQEGEENCTKILSIIETMKGNRYLLENWKELTYVYTEAAAYGGIGHFNETIDTKESLIEAKEYLEKGRDIFKEMGDEMPMLIAEKKIARIDAKITGEENMCLDTVTKIYAYLQRTLGPNDPSTIGAGIDVVEALSLSHHSIEAERLLTKLAENSRLCHGLEHESTHRTMSYLQRMKESRVVITREGQPFIALRYEDGEGAKNGVYVVKDPTIEEEKEVKISESEIIPYLGTPVICNGLQQETNLNGKIGDVREVCMNSGKCHVHFEESGLEPAQVEFNNLRIVFDLPLR